MIKIVVRYKGIVMKIVSEGMCGHCGKNNAVIECDGCGKHLCEKCRIFDIWNYGCGHGDTKAFCPLCNSDPAINVWKTPSP